MCFLWKKYRRVFDHLFFVCSCSYTAWERVTSKLVGSEINPDQSDIFQCFKEGGSLEWIKCSFDFFSKQLYITYVEQMIKLTDKAIRNMVSSLKYTSDHKLGSLMCIWFEVKGDQNTVYATYQQFQVVYSIRRQRSEAGQKRRRHQTFLKIIKYHFDDIVIHFYHH